jgi:hypothetical protein
MVFFEPVSTMSFVLLGWAFATVSVYFIAARKNSIILSEPIPPVSGVNSKWYRRVPASNAAIDEAIHVLGHEPINEDELLVTLAKIQYQQLAQLSEETKNQ